MSDVTRSTGDKRPEFSKSGSPARRQCSEKACSTLRNFEAAQRSKILFDDEAEIDLSDDSGEDTTLALLLDQRGWDSNDGSAPGSD